MLKKNGQDIRPYTEYMRGLLIDSPPDQQILDALEHIKWGKWYFQKRDTRVSLLEGPFEHLNFWTNGQPLIAPRGSRPNFRQRISGYSNRGTNTVTVEFKYDKTTGQHYQNGNWVGERYEVKNAYCVIIDMVAGGGAGSGGKFYDNGAGGGAGGYAAIILDMRAHPIVNITIGGGGTGQKSKNGGNGGNLIITDKQTGEKLIEVGGGQGGQGHNGGIGGNIVYTNPKVPTISHPGGNGGKEEQGSSIAAFEAKGLMLPGDIIYNGGIYNAYSVGAGGNNCGGAGGCSVFGAGGSGGKKVDGNTTYAEGSGGGGGGALKATTGGNGQGGQFNVYY